MRVWRLADGTPVGKPLTGHDDAVTAVAAGTLPDGDPVIVSGALDGTVRVWRLADGAPVGKPLGGHDGWVTAVAVGTLPDDTPVIVSVSGSFGSDALDSTVRVWRLADDAPVGKPLTGHDGAVTAVAVGTLPDGDPVIVSGALDGTVRVWRLASAARGCARRTPDFATVGIGGSLQIVTARRSRARDIRLTLRSPVRSAWLSAMAAPEGSIWPAAFPASRGRARLK